jgi:hypothetical protein
MMKTSDSPDFEFERMTSAHGTSCSFFSMRSVTCCSIIS